MVVELYVGMPSTRGVPEPPRQLKGFKRIALKPGETVRAQFELGPSAFSYWNTQAHRWEVMGGTYHIMVGSSSRDIQVEGAITATAVRIPRAGAQRG